MKTDNDSITGDQWKTLIKENDDYAIAAMMSIYGYQTPEEQYCQATMADNKKGFNAVDATFMTSLSQQYLKKGYLSKGQMFYVKKIMPKYVGQLPQNITIKPVQQQEDIQELIIKTAKLKNELIEIEFSTPDKKEFMILIGRVKTLSGRKFNAQTKRWTCPITYEAIDRLKEWGFDLDETLQKEDKVEQENIIIENSMLSDKLYPYQKDGVQFIESRNGRALIADEMGLGKTAQALQYLQIHPELRPAIIVVPASLKLNWEREVKLWVNIKNKTEILSGKKPKELINKDIFIINYDILNAWEDKLSKINTQIVVLDESHYIKNNKALRTKAVIRLCQNIKHVIALSGTPIINRPIEFFNTLKLIEPKLFPNKMKFAERYCGAKYTKWGWDFNGATNTVELNELLTSTLMVRRKKEDVLGDLPPKTKSIVPMEINNEKQYKKAADNIIQWIRENEGKKKAEKAKSAEVLVRIEKLKQLAVDGKITQCIDWIKTFIESEEKLVVFATHKHIIDTIMSEFKDIAVKLDGSTSPDQKQKAVDQFQNNPKIRLFVGNIQAAGVGITLTAASNVCFVEFPWTPGALSQAEDRIHRIGQEATNVNCYYLVANDTIEEDLINIIGSKQKTLYSILDGGDTDNLSTLATLLQKIKGE